MKASATLANLAWLASSVPAWRRFRCALRDPAGTQSRHLHRLLARHAATAFGRTHRFASLASYEEFARRVPLVTYDDLTPWIERICSGEPNILTPDPVTHLVPTSGATTARKLIPFTAGLQCEFNSAISPWIVDLFLRQPSLLCGPAYWSVSPLSRERNSVASAVAVGFADDSDYLGGTRARLVASVLAAPAALRHVSDLEAFRYVTLLCLLREPDLRLISVWHPSFLGLLLDALPSVWPELLADLRDGTCRYSSTLPPPVLRALRLHPCPSRAAELASADPLSPITVWPSLGLVSCWGDAHAASALDALRARLPDHTVQTKGLLATEACVTLPFGGAHPLAVCSHFFEFRAEDNRIVRAHELRLSETYEVIVTTAGGLWRYCLGDRVEVVGFMHQTPTLRFLGRAGHFSDLCGEKLSESFVAHALRHATAQLAHPPKFSLLAPSTHATPPHYTLFLEAAISAAASRDLERRLDDALGANPHYAHCRALGQLGPLRVHLIASAAYGCFVSAELARGARLGEIKPVALSSRTDWANQFPASSA
jgi:hypothetical protein